MSDGKKCITKKCEDCRLFLDWDMVGPGGLRRQEKHCVVIMLARELPKLIGAVDGCQEASNEARNRTIEFGRAAVETITRMTEKIPLLLEK